MEKEGVQRVENTQPPRMGLYRTMQHHLPTQLKRFVRRNSTFILLNLLIASLCWSAYTNGYIDNVNELLMSDKMRRRLKNEQHNEPVFDKQVAAADIGEPQQQLPNPVPNQANFEAPVIQQQQPIVPQPVVPQFQPAAAPVIPVQPVQQVPVAPPVAQQLPIAPVVPVAPAGNANQAAAAAPVAPGGVPGHDRFGPPSIAAWQNKVDGSPAPVGLDFAGVDDPNLKPPLKDFSRHPYQSDFNQEIPNPEFIFHNKLPKAGSSTMNNILIMLGRKNRFNYRKLNPHNLVGDSLISEGPLIDFVKHNVTSLPFVLLKHHLPMDFEKYGVMQPTYINVIRDPADWFQSHYYFERFGWTRKDDDRESFSGTDDDKMRTIDQCVEQNNPQCIDITWKYIEFFCGNTFPCQSRGVPESTLQQGLEKAMHNVEKNFFVVGVLEQFDDTLHLFEKLLPRYFNGATEVYHSDKIAEKRAATKTVGAVPMNNVTRHYFAQGPLRYEYQLYAFTRQLFNERLRRAGITSMNKPYGP